MRTNARGRYTGPEAYFHRFLYALRQRFKSVSQDLNDIILSSSVFPFVLILIHGLVRPGHKDIKIVLFPWNGSVNADTGSDSSFVANVCASA